jgi:RimJ/RimL family protein N-acetyltransferase
MKGIGCTIEGVLRSSYIKADGTRRDSAILSILKEEWEGGVKEMLKGKLI